jgi:hypothetical protein
LHEVGKTIEQEIGHLAMVIAQYEEHLLELRQSMTELERSKARRDHAAKRGVICQGSHGGLWRPDGQGT